MFFVRYQETDGGAYTTLTLTPGPTDVEYPPRRLLNKQTSVDGALVIQRPRRDTRERRWVWKNYRPGIATYANQWTVLQSLEYRTRLEAGKPATVEIWEDESTEGGFDRLDGGGNKVYTVVKFIEVDRVLRKGGGPVTYDESYISFVVADPTYSGF